VPPKIRDLERKLAAAGFGWQPGKGSHRHWSHVSGAFVVISGKGGDDAQRYQEKDVNKALAIAKKLPY